MPDGAPAALVTGGGTGIGASSRAGLRATATAWPSAAGDEDPWSRSPPIRGGLALALDIADEAEANRCIDETTTAFGRLDALVLNAGIVRAAPLVEMTVSDREATLRTNLTAAFLVARAALPHLRRQGGALVSVSSMSALRAGPTLGAYCASKAGLLALTQAIALEHAAEGVRANVVCPGWTRTLMADEEMDGLAAELAIDREAAYRRVTSLVPQRRPADADEIAEVIAWLVSPAASYVTGAALPIDGGSSIVDIGTVAFSGP